MSEQAPEHVDVIVDAWQVVTMNADRDIIRQGAVAVRGSTIVAVGKASEIHQRYTADRVLGGDRFVLTPGMVNTHIHITGEPLTRGYVPDDTPFVENVFEWLCPLYSVFDAAEERVSGQLAAVEMLRSGTTTFLEAGTIRFLDEVVDGLVEVGIRGRVGRWVWTCHRSRACTARAPMPRSHISSTSSTCTPRTPTVASGRGASWSVTPPAATRCGRPPKR